MKSTRIKRMSGGYKTHQCPECDNKFQTGGPIKTEVTKCGKCGKHVDGFFNNYCDNCGNKIYY